MSIFEKRINYKPFEYPEVLDFVNAINRSFWVHSEIDFTADTQDFHSHLNFEEKNAVKNALMAIAQAEIAVNTFWGDLYKYFPKPEINGVGSTFAESEFRHSEAYSRLIEVLGYNVDFENLLEIPIMKSRIDYLDSILISAKNDDRKTYVLTLILFTILIENVSLFSQFAVVLCFTRFKGLMKNISNIVSWTSIDEQVHANTGIYLINVVQKEYPEYLNQENKEYVISTLKQAIKLEEDLLNWIFEKGDLDIINRKDLLNFMKFRVDESLRKLGFENIYNISDEQYKPLAWFEEEVFANSLDDFFAKRPTEYTKHDKSISQADLF